MMNGLIAVVVAYILGSVPFGFLLVKFTSGADVRTQGSGNIGATNVLRTTGRGPAVATMLLDIAKGYAAVWIAEWLTDGSVTWMAIAALAVMAGHSFPVFLKFQGGKAVASFVGAFLRLTPAPLLATMLVFLVTVAATGFISAGSILAAGAFPLGVWLMLHPPAAVLMAALIAGAFIVFRHKSNLERLRSGTENRFRWTP